MIDLQFLQDLNQNLYDNPWGENFKGWKRVQTYTDNTGVVVNLYEQHEQFIIAIRGTDTDFTKRKVSDIIKDFKDDLRVYQGELPQQYKSIKAFYNTIKSKTKNLIVTGYSLGGSLAQMLGNEFGLETITFEALGTKHIMGIKHATNISNYINVLDAFVHPTLPNQVGKVYAMAITDKQEIYPNEVISPYFHWYPNYGNPNKVELYDSKKENPKPLSKYLKDGIINKSMPLKNDLQQKAKDLIKSYHRLY